MKALKWVAATALLAGVAVLMLFVFSWPGVKHEETPERAASVPVSEADIPESIRNMPLQDIRSEGDDILLAELRDATWIDGFPCAAGEVRFIRSSQLYIRSGQLYKCVIAEDFVIQGNLIPKNTLVKYVVGNVWFYYFPEDTNIQGITCAGGKAGPANSAIVSSGFYSSGRLRDCYSSSNVMIQGVPCRKHKFGLLSNTPLDVNAPIVLYENGNLSTCTLSSDAEIDGQSISKGSRIEISQDGELTILDGSWQRRAMLWAAEILGY